MNYLFLLSYGGLSFCRKKDFIIFVFGIVLLWSIFAFNTSNPDFFNYEYQYYHGGRTYSSEPIYCGMMILANRLGLSFRAFVSIEAMLGLVLISTAIYRLSPYPNPVLFLYALYPFYIDVVQTRSFLAQACIIFSLIFISKRKEDRRTKDIIFGVGFVLASIGFHYSAILFVPILILLFYNENRKTLFFILIPLLYAAVPVLVNMLLPLVSAIIGGHKTFLWLATTKNPSIAHIVRILVVRMGLLFLVLLMRQFSGRTNKETEVLYSFQKINNTHNEGIIIEESNNILLLAYMYITFNAVFELFFNSAYERMSRPGLIISSILISRYIKQIDNKNNQTIIWIIIVVHSLLYLLTSFFFYKVGGASYFTRVFRCVFENSILWD